jgi:hypothetical protein
MSKVPVGASIAHAYEFLFGRFFQIIGTVWVPALLYGLAVYVALQLTHPFMPIQGASAAVGMFITALTFFAFFLAIRSVIGISLTQEALGVRKDLTLAHFVLGPRELRLFFGYLRYYLVFIGAYIALIAISIGLIVAAKMFGAHLLPQFALGKAPIAVVAAIVVDLILAVWFVLAMVRLMFLIAPVASVEHHTRLSRAWAISKGSEWRIAIVLIVTFVPAAIAAWIVSYFVLGPADVSAFLEAIRTAKPGHPAQTHDFMAAHAGTIAIIAGVFCAIDGALLAGASALAYRVVTGHEDPELEDDAALVAPLLAPVEAPGAYHEPVPVHEEPPPVHEEHHGHHDHHHEDHGRHDERSDDDDARGDEDHGHGNHGDSGHGHGHHGSSHDGHAVASHAQPHDDDAEDEDESEDEADSHGPSDHGHGDSHGHEAHHGHNDGHHAASHDTDRDAA